MVGEDALNPAIVNCDGSAKPPMAPSVRLTIRFFEPAFERLLEGRCRHFRRRFRVLRICDPLQDLDGCETGDVPAQRSRKRPVWNGRAPSSVD
jgi:hypothetical protein